VPSLYRHRPTPPLNSSPEPSSSPQQSRGIPTRASLPAKCKLLPAASFVPVPAANSVLTRCVLLACLGMGLAPAPPASSQPPASPSAPQPPADDTSLPPVPETTAPLRVVKLLWKAQPASAATALERVLSQAVERNEILRIADQLEPLAARFQEVAETPTDPRFAGSVAGLAVLEASGRQRLIHALSNPDLPLTQRELLFRVWLAIDAAAAWQYGSQLIASPLPASPADASWLDVIMGRLLQADRMRAAELLIDHWQRLPANTRVAAIEPLTQQAASMRLLVSAIAEDRISKDLLNTNQLLKWSAAGDPQLSEAIAKVWGQLRAADDQERKAVVRQALELFRSGRHGDPEQGVLVFKRVCSQCHRLHGEGIDVGPEITSNGRGSFEQLVSNVFDPSLVIGEAFQAKNVLTADGRVLSGLIVAQDAQRLTLKVQGGKTIELDREEDIDDIKDSSKSLMPDGLEQQMSEQEMLDLFAYLSLAKPLSAAENATIPGTPETLVPE
jgi:putative heme-binding domain-containing protein